MLISRSQEVGGKGVCWFGGGGRASYVLIMWVEQRDKKRQTNEPKPTRINSEDAFINLNNLKLIVACTDI